MVCRSPLLRYIQETRRVCARSSKKDYVRIKAFFRALFLLSYMKRKFDSSTDESKVPEEGEPPFSPRLLDALAFIRYSNELEFDQLRSYAAYRHSNTVSDHARFHTEIESKGYAMYTDTGGRSDGLLAVSVNVNVRFWSDSTSPYSHHAGLSRDQPPWFRELQPDTRGLSWLPEYCRAVRGCITSPVWTGDRSGMKFCTIPTELTLFYRRSGPLRDTVYRVLLPGRDSLVDAKGISSGRVVLPDGSIHRDVFVLPRTGRQRVEQEMVQAHALPRVLARLVLGYLEQSVFLEFASCGRDCADCVLELDRCPESGIKVIHNRDHDRASDYDDQIREFMVASSAAADCLTSDGSVIPRRHVIQKRFFSILRDAVRAASSDPLSTVYVADDDGLRWTPVHLVNCPHPVRVVIADYQNRPGTTRHMAIAIDEPSENVTRLLQAASMYPDESMDGQVAKLLLSEFGSMEFQNAAQRPSIGCDFQLDCCIDNEILEEVDKNALLGFYKTAVSHDRPKKGTSAARCSDQWRSFDNFWRQIDPRDAFPLVGTDVERNQP